jgi:hypothetical protein
MTSLKAAIVAVLITAFLCLNAHAGATDIFGTSGGDPNHLHWDHVAPFTVQETIEPLTGESYKYSYSFKNTDTSEIWLFAVCSSFITSDATKFTGHSDWHSPVWRFADSVYPEYDATYLDPSIVGFTGLYSNDWPATPSMAIQVGEKVTGFSFIAPWYDPSAKIFFYETLASGYTQQNATGAVAAVGQTVFVPEPATVALLACGFAVAKRVRRRG